MNFYSSDGLKFFEDASGTYVRKADYRDLQRQLAEVTKERDQLRAMLNLADALRNKERNSK